MAVHSVSLATLARLRKQRSVGPVPYPEAGFADSHGPAARQPTQVGAQSPPPSQNPALLESLEELLRGSTAELDAIPDECSLPVSKVLLVLICRLASIESRLARLIPSGPTIPGTLKGGHAKTDYRQTGDTSKSELLDQVFQKNLALRNRS